MLAPLPPRRPAEPSARESFLLKSILVLSALVVGSFVLAAEEFYFSGPDRSLSQTEAALRLAAR